MHIAGFDVLVRKTECLHCSGQYCSWLLFSSVLAPLSYFFCHVFCPCRAKLNIIKKAKMVLPIVRILLSGLCFEGCVPD